MFWDSFLCEKQSDELAGYDYWYQEWPEAPEKINPEEYFDWCAWVYGGAFNEEEK